MGFLDSKERILDIVLTDRGKELLSQNLLEFKYYAFSDDGIDYGAALTASLAQSGSVDEYMRRQVTSEAVQYVDFKQHSDLNNFLYTIPSGRVTLPTFTSNFDGILSATLKRNFFVDELSLSANKQIEYTQQPIAVILQSTIAQDTLKNKTQQYVADQQGVVAANKVSDGTAEAGLSINASNLILLANSQVLDTETGFVQELNVEGNNVNEVLSVSDKLEVVTGLSRAKINLALKSSEGPVVPINGFLIEVYESGSDGTIVKLFDEDIIDVLEDKVIKKGFGTEVFVDIDATSEELIDEQERLRKKALREQKLAFERLQEELQKKIEG